MPAKKRCMPSVSVSDATYRKLRSVAAERECSVADLVRQALRDIISVPASVHRQQHEDLLDVPHRMPMSDNQQRWWWIGYTDEKRPKGDRALGAVIIRSWDADRAVALARSLGLAPLGAEALVGGVPASWGDPPAGFVSRLIGKAEAEVLARQWDPQRRGLADAEQIKNAFLDDKSQVGEPLFERKRKP